MDKNVQNYIVDKISSLLKKTAQKEGREAKISYKNNIFGARLRSVRGEVEVDIIFEEKEAFIHLTGGLVSQQECYETCLDINEFESKFPKIENFIRNLFLLKLIKK